MFFRRDSSTSIYDKAMKLLYVILLFSGFSEAQQVFIWKGKSAGYEVRWTEENIQAISLTDQKIVFDAAAQCADDMEQVAFDDMDCEYGRTMAVVSLVGSLLTIFDEWSSYCMGTAHPQYYQLYKTIDLTNGNTVTLTDYFPEEKILEALRSDPYIGKALKQYPGIPTNSVTEFIPKLTEQAGCEFGFDEDLLTRLAFHHVEGDRVAIRLGVSNISHHVCRKEISQLGILLPIPENLLKPLENAKAQTEGILMENLQKVSGDKKMHYFRASSEE
jgi:hypothetical protein